jgi:hypothetical protein
LTTISDVDALTLLLTVEGLLFAALGITAAIAAPNAGRSSNLPVSPGLLVGCVSGAVSGVGVAILCVWCAVFTGGDYGGFVRLMVAAAVMLATLMQTVVGATVFYGTVKR